MRTLTFLRKVTFIMVCALTFCAYAQATNLKVNCNGTGALSTINGALKLLNPQGPNTITVSGSCKENVVIQSFDRLTLIANPGASITDASSGTLDVIDINDSQRVTVQNFTITGGAEGIVCENLSICRFSGNTVQGSADSGVQVAQSQATFQNDVIQNNAGDGLDIFQFANVFATGVTVQGSQAVGVGLFAHSTLIALSTTTQSNSSAGMLATTDSFIRLFAATIRNNGADGVTVSAGSQVGFGSAIGKSVVTNNSGSGVDVDDLSFALLQRGGQTINGNNLGGGSFDVTCRPQFSATRGVANIGGGTTNCVEPPQ